MVQFGMTLSDNNIVIYKQRCMAFLWPIISSWSCQPHVMLAVSLYS